MKYLLPFVLLLSFQTTSFAKHIIGGVVSYECLGGGTYRFTLKMYRDCSDPTGANFDFQAPFAVYKGDNQVALDVIEATYNFPINNVEPDIDNPCLQLPPNLCVEEAIYEFEYTFPQWPSNDSYHLTFQRCCRNATVTNIQTPGDVGATFTVEVTPASQALCNDSPFFETFPPIVICAGEPLEYDHAAFDAQGDQIIYELCEPLIGGGMDFGGGGGGTPGFECDDLVPNPACPPPYETVQYAPPYSATNPIGGNPAVTIDPVTGLLSGTPEVLGQFSVAVCAYEYRNGQLLSVIRRDVQFNVAECTPLVEADLISDALIDDFYVFERCDDLEITIDNESTQNADLFDYRWDFLINGSIVSYDEWSPSVTFPGAGEYTGALILNPGTACGDSANIRVTIHPEIIADFEFDYDTCIYGPVGFVDQSYIDGIGSFSKYEWLFGDGYSSELSNPVHIYEQPNDYVSRLVVEDENGCADTIVKQVNYRPVPAILVISPNDTLGCPPADIVFNNLSNPVDNTYEIFWDFGDGNTSTELNPTHVYEEEGIYTVSLEILSPIGCVTDTVFENLIRIVPPPMADFDINPKNLSNLQPFSNFIDQSIDAAHWEWQVDGELIAHTQNVENYEFRDTGMHEVTLYIVHPQKCLDTISRFIDVRPEWRFHLPNAFTPNEDTHNDVFKGKGLTLGIQDYNMQIWDRWGALVFESDNPDIGWNGQINNTGRKAQTGVYTVLVSFIGPRGEPFKYSGFATLFR
ncbi:PKD domain-containing protein [Saprospiraceae bacterium]|jgi:gliding motility-associated-like protein|nr:PKD domain-containing protein [Bacteroidota bacterium]MDB4727282.1 PKD domain-containing protein [Saprospiraceae bacterium]MDF1864781.1 PKD domain-containing protein [Saprospiraceae bacterium]